MPEFQPSAASVDPNLALLKRLRKAVELIEQYIEAGGQLPPWVQNRLHQASPMIMLVASFVLKSNRKETP